MFFDTTRFIKKQLAHMCRSTLIMLMCIGTLLIGIPVTGSAMVKDAEHKVGIKVAKSVVTTIEPMVDSVEESVEIALEATSLGKAPTVKGFTETAAIEALVKADVKREKVLVKHEKMTFKSLVEKGSNVFFGEVEEQIISQKAITLVIPQADMTDELTAAILKMGSRLAWPVPGHETLSSHFGRRSSPGGIGSTNHQGIDIPAPTGTPIIAVKEGIVEKAAPMGGYGNCVVIDHQNGFKSLYGHMSQITCNAGDKVKPGDIIGKVGSTGWSTGPHLHFSLIKDGVFIDPEPFFTGKENIAAGSEVSENVTAPEETPAVSDTEKPDDSDKNDSDTEKPSDDTEKNTSPTTKPKTPAATQPKPSTTSPSSSDKKPGQNTQTTSPTTKPTEPVTKPEQTDPPEPTTVQETTKPTVPDTGQHNEKNISMNQKEAD